MSSHEESPYADDLFMHCISKREPRISITLMHDTDFYQDSFRSINILTIAEKSEVVILLQRPMDTWKDDSEMVIKEKSVKQIY
jgi:hypothetical protein